jgi:hypothetical protein
VRNRHIEGGFTCGIQASQDLFVDNINRIVRNLVTGAVRTNEQSIAADPAYDECHDNHVRTNYGVHCEDALGNY